jgi:hypothetical protein
MSTKFSATAPRFTEEADRREQESLSPAERKEILNDVQGTAAVDSAVVETPELRAKAVAKMEEELTRIPEHEKQEYMLALEICPELVTLETDPLRFLRSEDFHAKVRIAHTFIPSILYASESGTYYLRYKALTFPSSLFIIFFLL